MWSANTSISNLDCFYITWTNTASSSGARLPAFGKSLEGVRSDFIEGLLVKAINRFSKKRTTHLKLNRIFKRTFNLFHKNQIEKMQRTTRSERCRSTSCWRTLVDLIEFWQHQAVQCFCAEDRASAAELHSPSRAAWITWKSSRLKSTDRMASNNSVTTSRASCKRPE